MKCVLDHKYSFYVFHHNTDSGMGENMLIQLHGKLNNVKRLIEITSIVFRKISINNMVKTRRHSNDMILSIDVQNLIRHPLFKECKKQIAHERIRRTEHQLDLFKLMKTFCLYRE